MRSRTGRARKTASGPAWTPVAPVASWVAVGSATCPTPTPPRTGGRTGSRKPPGAGLIACCAADRDGQWWYESLSGAPMPDWLGQHPGKTPAPANRPAPTCQIDWEAADRPAHRSGVLACLEAIARRRGLPGMACAPSSPAQSRGRRLDFFIDGVARTSPARAAYVAGSGAPVASLSPELFLRRRGGVVASSPIKGTLPLDAWPSALRASPKEVARTS